jgi:hypothetical protein
LLLALAAIFGWLNRHLLGLPLTVELLPALAGPVLRVAVDAVVPGLGLGPQSAASSIGSIFRRSCSTAF